MKRLGKNQLALLLIIDEATAFESAEGTVTRYKAFANEETIFYKGVDGERAEFFIMTKDLNSIDRLVERGLVRQERLRLGFSITRAGRELVQKLRSKR